MPPQQGLALLQGRVPPPQPQWEPPQRGPLQRELEQWELEQWEPPQRERPQPDGRAWLGLAAPPQQVPSWSRYTPWYQTQEAEVTLHGSCGVTGCVTLMNAWWTVGRRG